MHDVRILQRLGGNMWAILAALIAGPAGAADHGNADYTAAVSAPEHSVEVDWFQLQTRAVHSRWTRALAGIGPTEVAAARGGHARVDVRVDESGKVVAAALGRSTGSSVVDQSLLASLDDVALAPPPSSLPGMDGFVRFSVYIDVGATRSSASSTEAGA